MVTTQRQVPWEFRLGHGDNQTFVWAGCSHKIKICEPVRDSRRATSMTMFWGHDCLQSLWTCWWHEGRFYQYVHNTWTHVLDTLMAGRLAFFNTLITRRQTFCTVDGTKTHFEHVGDTRAFFYFFKQLMVRGQTFWTSSWHEDRRYEHIGDTNTDVFNILMPEWTDLFLTHWWYEERLLF